MLTDEELTAGLSSAFHESVPELGYARPLPRVPRRGVSAGVVTTSALAAATAIVLTPAALQHDAGRVPQAGPGSTDATHHSSPVERRHRAARTLDVAGLHLSSASVAGDPGPLYFVGGDGLAVPDDAQQVDLGLSVDVFFAAHPTGEDPQVYIRYRACPDTVDGCDGAPPPTHVYGVLAPGWTRQQLMQLMEHPVKTQRAQH
jgi:hypothetical protein